MASLHSWIHLCPKPRSALPSLGISGLQRPNFEPLSSKFNLFCYFYGMAVIYGLMTSFKS
jgi:hypothetical protein